MQRKVERPAASRFIQGSLDARFAKSSRQRYRCVNIGTSVSVIVRDGTRDSAVAVTALQVTAPVGLVYRRERKSLAAYGTPSSPRRSDGEDGR